MSQISLDGLINEHPESGSALRKIEDWMHDHSDSPAIYPNDLAKEVRGVDAFELATALGLLVKAGFLRRVYKVLTPNGVYAEGEFDDPTKIPPKLPDRWERYFETADSDVVPIFQKVA